MVLKVQGIQPDRFARSGTTLCDIIQRVRK